MAASTDAGRTVVLSKETCIGEIVLPIDRVVLQQAKQVWDIRSGSCEAQLGLHALAETFRFGCAGG
ncbi:MAG: hypothetical protein ACR2NM_15510 [Bythopirellula sp.]